MKKVKLLSLILLSFFMFIINMKSLTCLVNDPSTTSQTFRVLVVEIDPILYSITNKSLYPNNDGHPKVSEWFNLSVDKSINELKRDINESSHGYLNTVIVKREYLNEFPTYKNQLRLSNGTYAYKYDEATYVSMSRSTSNNSRGDWYRMIGTSEFKQVDSIGAGNYDYAYLINKLNLINRKNNNEFDMVWIFNTSPIGTFETMMVGRNPYWVNGTAMTYNCDNFVIAGLEIARTDSQFHSLGHLTENILRNVFGQPKDIYAKSTYSVNSKADYNKLNLWEKFTLTSYNNNTSYTSVGNTHFPYNATDGYDYGNPRNVLTNYKEWMNYPNVTGDRFEYASSSDFLNSSINQSINSSSTETKANDRLWQRFWFSLLPHITGYSEDGYLNNWWKYFYSLDYVKNLSANSTSIEVTEGDMINVNLTLSYYSGKTAKIENVQNYSNVSIGNKSIIDFKNGYLYANKKGTSSLTLKYDGKSITYTINVKEKKKEESPKETPKETPKEEPKETPKEENPKETETPKEENPKEESPKEKETNKETTQSDTTSSSNSNNKSTSTTTTKKETKAETIYTVNFIADNGYTYDAIKCTLKNSKCLITTPIIDIKSNEKAVGWSKNADGSGILYKEYTTYNIKGNLTLYAVVDVIPDESESVEESETPREVVFYEEYEEEDNGYKEILTVVAVVALSIGFAVYSSISQKKHEQNIL